MDEREINEYIILEYLFNNRHTTIELLGEIQKGLSSKLTHSKCQQAFSNLDRDYIEPVSGYKISDQGIEQYRTLKRKLNKYNWKKRFEWLDLRLKPMAFLLLFTGTCISCAWNFIQINGAKESEQTIELKQDTIQSLQSDLVDCQSNTKRIDSLLKQQEKSKSIGSTNTRGAYKSDSVIR